MYEFILVIVLARQTEAWQIVSEDIEKELAQINTDGKECSLEKVAEDVYLVTCTWLDIHV